MKRALAGRGPGIASGTSVIGKPPEVKGGQNARVNSEAWNRRYAGTELLWSATPNRFLVAEVEGLPPGRALDLACGEGRNAIWLAERGFEVTGVDFSDVALERARRIAAGRGVEVEWTHADVTEYEPPLRAFDLVVVLYLHLP